MRALTYVHSVPPQLPLTYLCPAADHTLTNIYGTLVIYYIYPPRPLMSRLISIPCDACLFCSHLEVVFGDCRGERVGDDEYDKNINPLSMHAAKAQQLAVPICVPLVFVCVRRRRRRGEGRPPPLI